MKQEIHCGICKKIFPIKDLIGPFCGEPFTWYCKTCKKTIDIYTEGVKKHKEWFDEIMKSFGREGLKIIRD